MDTGETAGPVPTSLAATAITLQKTDPSDATKMIVSDAYVDGDITTLSPGRFIATINYEFDPLPVYVGLASSVKVSATTLNGVAPGTGEPNALPVGGPTTPGNNAPAFAADTATRSVAENTAAGTAIGTAVSATDADGDTLTYSLGGTDAASFAIVSTSGQLQTKAALDYETKTSYMGTVTAADGNGGTDSIAVTINVTDVDDTTDPPTATITVSDHKKVGVKGTFMRPC